MTRPVGLAAFALGLAAIGWVAFGYLGTNVLALSMTLLIAAFYTAGGLELQGFQRATSRLSAALAALHATPPDLGHWLATLPASLQNPVRLRIEGERSGLPGPLLTPYLVGLLVLLGMLGTFLGMVVTLDGAVMALQSTTDLPAMRAALAAPVKGLGLAFGTSVAGVAGSAMLGLVSALVRAERLQAAQQLELRIATGLRVFSRVHQRESTLAALQAQARALPEVVDALHAMTARIEQLAQRSEQVDARWLAGHDRLVQHVQVAYADLASSVDRSLQRSLVDSARVAGAAIQPMVEATMTGLALQTAAFQQRLTESVGLQLDGLTDRFGAAVTTVSDGWTSALARHERSSQQLADGLDRSLGDFGRSFEQGAASLLASVDERQAAAQRDLADAALATAQRTAALSLQQQERICATLERSAGDIQAQGRADARQTIAELSALVDAAAQAPRAAGELVAELRHKLADSSARDNALLDERARLMATLGTLLDAVNQASTAQRAAVDSLVESSAAALRQAGERLGEQADAGSARLSGVAAQLGLSAVELSSLGDAFGGAVQLFGDSSQALAAQLQRIEAALAKSTARSDEQLAYYVAQAREIVELSLSSQKQIVDDLQRLAIRRAPLAGEPA